MHTVGDEIVTSKRSNRKTRPSPALPTKKIPSSPTDGLEVGAGSETGYVRKENEDKMSGSHTSIGRLFIVADGMGGYKGGAHAAELTDKTITEYVKHASPQQPVFQILRAALQEANRVVYEASQSGDPRYSKMGSTAVVALISNGLAHIAHIGDSRAYLHRDGELRRLTKDHTVGNRMVKLKILTKKQAKTHPDAEILDRGIGKDPTVEAEVRKPLELRPGDGILLCTDGLSGYATDTEINNALLSVRSDTIKTNHPSHAQLIANRLIDLALGKGGEDNVTVQYIKFPKGQCARRTLREIAYLIFGLIVGGLAVYLYHFPNHLRSLPIINAMLIEKKGADEPLEKIRVRSAESSKEQIPELPSAATNPASGSQANEATQPLDGDNPGKNKKTFPP